MEASKVQTVCKDLAQLSYKCLEKNNGDSKFLFINVDMQPLIEYYIGTQCVEFFTNYRKCIKEEHDGIIEERRKKGAWLS
jgi:hypothetical protein